MFPASYGSERKFLCPAGSASTHSTGKLRPRKREMAESSAVLDKNIPEM
jgi:hypothetical protein